MHPKHISILDFSYQLPEELIARYPLPERDASRLLLYRDGKITEDTYRQLHHHLPENALMIFNDSKVVEARLIFQKPTGGTIEIFCLEPHEKYPDLSTALNQKEKLWWKCLIGGASKWKKGQVLEKKWGDGKICLYASYIEKQKDDFLIEFSWEPKEQIFAEILHHAGLVPLPPYLKREAEASDLERYQTVYAEREGSVAAPTAGLHFTDRLLENLSAKKVEQAFVTLHVGAGTFKPVKSKTLEEHLMHQEFIEVSAASIRTLLAPTQRPVIAVGTTSLRTLESLYWLGLKTMEQPLISSEQLVLHQWDPYELPSQHVPKEETLGSLLAWLDRQALDKLVTKTELLIAPGYSFKIVDVLLTNFHQPQSTLLLLIAAFIGEDWKNVYQYALDRSFRFLSYGDGCLLFRKQPRRPF
jgi:S-adenosylmethionine:tRNA ribosyltransferase-isomerase